MLVDEGITYGNAVTCLDFLYDFCSLKDHGTAWAHATLTGVFCHTRAVGHREKLLSHKEVLRDRAGCIH